jgi:hypothetical protein
MTSSSTKQRAQDLHLGVGLGLLRVACRLAIWPTRSSRMTTSSRWRSAVRASAWRRSDPSTNDADHRAWMSSIEHIRATPGFSTWRWPPDEGMSPEENLRDLRRHADDFERRVGFTYTVLDDEDVVVGCVYIYPSRAAPDITEVRSWVTASRAQLDSVLHESVDSWLAADWPFTDVRYRNRV